MEEKRISFDTAKLAKEKGFGIIEYNHAFNPNTGEELSGSIVTQLMMAEPDLSKHLFRPTQSLLQKWLREGHKVRVFVTNTAAGEFTYNIYVVNPIEEQRVGSPWDRSHCHEGFRTFELALEKALQEGLKLIKIADNEKTE